MVCAAHKGWSRARAWSHMSVEVCGGGASIVSRELAGGGGGENLARP